jgi:hypothetical protein
LVFGSLRLSYAKVSYEYLPGYPDGKMWTSGLKAGMFLRKEKRLAVGVMYEGTIGIIHISTSTQRLMNIGVQCSSGKLIPKDQQDLPQVLASIGSLFERGKRKRLMNMLMTLFLFWTADTTPSRNPGVNISVGEDRRSKPGRRLRLGSILSHSLPAKNSTSAATVANITSNKH